MAANSNDGPENGRSLNGAGVLRISRTATVSFGKSSCKNVATWNVRSMYVAGKINNTIMEMKRLNISILGISEMRWPQSGKCVVDDHIIYYVGEDSTYHRNGVAFIVTKEVEKSVLNFVPISDRIAMLEVQASPVNINFVQVYAPTCDSDDNAIESFYNDLNLLLKDIKSRNVIMVMGDMNAKVGYGKEQNLVGEYGLGIRNERGERFIQFCIENKLAIMNTFFKLPKRRLYTWKSPGDTPYKPIRNQIDYLTVNQRYRNAIKSVKTYPGADVFSDHSLLLAKVRFRFKKVEIQNKRSTVDLNKLKDPFIREEISCLVENEVGNMLSLDQGVDIENAYINFKEISNNLLRSKCKQDRPPKKKTWMTDEILDLMEERRKHKNHNKTRYQQLNAEIKRYIRQAKSEWFLKECTEIEEMDGKHDIFNLHKKIKEAAGFRRSNVNSNLVDKNGQIILDIEEKLIRWKEYIEELFADDRDEDHGIRDGLIGPSLTIDEVKKAIVNAKNRKSPGPDEIPTELLKILGENSIRFLTRLFNAIYDKGVIPSDWLKSTFIALPKKLNAKDCKDHRTISLMSHVLKLFLRVIHQRIYPKIEEHISNTQFGFRKGLGAREALFSIQVLVQRCRDINCNVYLCFIDFEKAFDKVRHNKLIKILQSTGIDNKDVRFIANLYWHQKANLRIKDRITTDIAITRGVRQGCILSPLLFNLYSEQIFKEALEDVEQGIKINGVTLNNLRYADDTVLIADSLEGLQSLLNKVVEKCEEYGLKLNTKKTKYMIISKNQVNDEGIVANNERLQRTEKINYLGTTINDNWDPINEVKCRIEKARAAFMRLRNVLCGHDLSLQLRIRILRCYVFSVLLYGVEAWTLTDTALGKLEAFEMWTYRRMLRISWQDRIRNDDVIVQMKKEKEIVHHIKARKLAYFGHIMRNPSKYNILHLIIQGKIIGKRGPGRRRTLWLKNLAQWYGQATGSLFRVAMNKSIIANMIANVR